MTLGASRLFYNRKKNHTKMNLAHILVFFQLSKACAELVLRRLVENQSLELSCPLQRDLGSPTAFHLYHRGAQSQTTLLSVAEGGEPRVDPERRGRLRLYGGLDSAQLNVTLSQLRPSDTGLYMWELSYREGDGADLRPGTHKVFLLVDGEGTPCRCSAPYPALLFTLCAAAGLVVLVLCWLAAEKCMKARGHHISQPPSAPIYEEMTRKEHSDGISQNNHEAPAHLEEENFPVYANPNIRPQDNYYACPRLLALRA